jgi:hypothetical protein
LILSIIDYIGIFIIYLYNIVILNKILLSLCFGGLLFKTRMYGHINIKNIKKIYFLSELLSLCFGDLLFLSIVCTIFIKIKR